MSEETKQKNRVLYNVQDLYFGLISGEKNYPVVTGDGGEEIEVLKRIHRVQSVSYDFNTVRSDVGVLGRSNFDDNVLTQPPDINVSISHSMEGLNNETKMGFNVMTIGSSFYSNKEFTRNFVYSGDRQQNIYLAVNQNQTDIREAIRDPSEIPGLISSGRYGELGHGGTDKMGMVVFQNCYLTQYTLDVSVGNLPKADTSWLADNAIYINSASGQHVPWLDTKKAEVYKKQNNLNKDAKFMVPGNYERQNPYFDPNYTFKPADAKLTISTRPAESDIIIQEDFEGSTHIASKINGGETFDHAAHAESCLGLKSLEVIHPNNSHAGGVEFTLPADNRLRKDTYYTIEVYLRTDAAKNKRVFIQVADSNNSSASQTNLGGHKDFQAADGCMLYKKRIKLDKDKPTHAFVYSHNSNQKIWIDNFKIYKDAENPPLRFHTDLLQSFQLNIPLNRDNIACVGHKYYVDRPISLPVKSTFAVAMSSQDGEFPVTTALGEDVKGDFLDNLRKDEEYDLSLDFVDDQMVTGMKYRIFGARFESVNYGADIDNNKTSTLNFSMSNDYDYGRNVISAEGKGLYVLDVLVNDSLVPLTDDQGNFFVDPFPHRF